MNTCDTAGYPAHGGGRSADLAVVQAWTRDYASFSQSRSGLGHLLAAAAALVAWFANIILGPSEVTTALTIASTILWLLGKEIIRRCLYQPFGHARESWQHDARHQHVRLVTITAGVMCVEFLIMLVVMLVRLARGTPPDLQILGYLVFVALTPWIAWRYLRTPNEFVVGVLLLCACAVTSFGGAYSLWGPLILLPLFAVLLARRGIREHRQFRRLVDQLHARTGDEA